MYTYIYIYLYLFIHTCIMKITRLQSLELQDKNRTRGASTCHVDMQKKELFTFKIPGCLLFCFLIIRLRQTNCWLFPIKNHNFVYFFSYFVCLCVGEGVVYAWVRVVFNDLFYNFKRSIQSIQVISRPLGTLNRECWFLDTSIVLKYLIGCK